MRIASSRASGSPRPSTAPRWRADRSRADHSWRRPAPGIVRNRRRAPARCAAARRCSCARRRPGRRSCRTRPRRPRRARAPAATATVSAVWLSVPSPGRATISSGRSRASARSANVSRSLIGTSRPPEPSTRMAAGGGAQLARRGHDRLEARLGCALEARGDRRRDRGLVAQRGRARRCPGTRAAIQAASSSSPVCAALSTGHGVRPPGRRRRARRSPTSCRHRCRCPVTRTSAERWQRGCGHATSA